MEASRPHGRIPGRADAAKPVAPPPYCQHGAGPFEESFASSFGSEEEFDANTPGALTATLGSNKLALLIRYENSARRAYHKALTELRSLQSERRKAQQAEQKAAHDAHVRQVVGEMEAANEKMNMDLIAMCERIPPVPNDGYKYIVPSSASSFGRVPVSGANGG